MHYFQTLDRDNGHITFFDGLANGENYNLYFKGWPTGEGEQTMTISHVSSASTQVITSTGEFDFDDENLKTSGEFTDGSNGVTASEAEDAHDHISNDGSDHSFIDQSVVIGATPTFGDIKGETKCWDFTLINPNAAHDIDAQFPIAYVKSALTITKIEVALNTTSQDVAGDLKYADDLNAFTNAATINDFDTSSGVRSDTSISSGTVAINKWIYIDFDSQPHADITWMSLHIEWDYD